MNPFPNARVLLLVLFLAWPPLVQAVRVEGLYRAEVEVVDKGAAARSEGFRTALERVLVKVTGQSDVVSESSLEPLLEQSERYVQQYRYEEIEDAAARAGTAAPDAEPVPRYRMQVVFGRARIDELLKERDVATWDVYRPQVLVWLAFDDGQRRSLVAADHSGAVDRALRDVAEHRGLPLLLPLMDTEDQRRIEYFDIQGGFLERVREASSRYRAAMVLVGHVYPASGGWRGQWTLLESEDRTDWTTRSASAGATVRDGVGALAEQLADRYAGREGEQRTVRLRVRDAAALGDYARVGRYLEQLPRVDTHEVVQVRPQELLFELSVRGRLSDLERAIALDDLLEPVERESRATSAGVSVPGAESGGVVSPAGGDDDNDAVGGTTDGGADGDAIGADGVDPNGGPVFGFAHEGAGPAGEPGPEAELVYRLAG